MIVAYHLILSTYGFWLPNDPRGSWSDFVGAWELLRYGKATKVTTPESLAHVPHDRELRRQAKAALKHAPVRFSGVQARAVGRGFAVACAQGGYVVRACAILPDHAHLLLARHDRDIAQIVAHFKGCATRHLRVEGLYPHRGSDDPLPPVWARSYWKVFIDDPEHLGAAVRYVEKNPVKEGKPPQRWSFVHPADRAGQARRLNETSGLPEGYHES